MKKLILAVIISLTALMQNTIAQTSNPQLSKVITAYFNVKNSLTSDNGDSVKAEAGKLYSAINSIETSKLPDKQKKEWSKYMGKLSGFAAQMKGTTDIGKQREAFAGLSKNMYDVFRKLNINTIDVYYQYCPMVQNYWLSEKPAISNPYLGKKMPTCGQTVETLKATK